MSLNIQWRFQDPIDFSGVLTRTLENKQKTYNEMAKNLGEGIRNTHDYLLDREMAELMEGQTRQQQIDRSNSEQMNKEILLIQNEIKELETQKAQLKNQLVELEKQLENENGKYLQNEIQMNDERNSVEVI
ncbi:hypothetical protein B7982_05405 [Fibrobacter sp. UWB2]|uniref:hypothetical protein n=1 Tax=Fibrobacter sp. UWB2 TaxID=1964358 RepID=UPI000B52090A|nr:hypothetical protein [Fibrobacter sp. UWB2]OWV23867.1 hypothetical protein B7982_05405 [Fibrobacter sp. UWB2]